MYRWEDVQAVALDMDGVVYIGQTLRRGIGELLALLGERGIEYRILTNRSIFTSEEISANLASMGLQFDAEKITTASQVVASYLREHESANRAFTIGGDKGLAAALRAHDVKQIPLERFGSSDFVHLPGLRPQQQAPLVMGWTEDYGYTMATTVYRLGPCISGLYSTGADRCFADEHGQMAGIVWYTASVEALLAKKAINPAKPNRYGLGLVLRQLGHSPAETLVIGDSASDVQMGNEAGCRTLLVLGGATSRADLPHLSGDCVPGQVVEELCDLL